MSDEITIRPVGPEDSDRCVELTGEVFGLVSIDATIERALGKATDAGWAEIKGQVVRRELETNPAGCFVAESGGKIVGYVSTTINELASRGVISNVAVAKDAQGRGIGRMLLERAIEHFRSLGLAQAKIVTRETNPVGQHLYPSLGFREVVRQIHYVMPLD